MRQGEVQTGVALAILSGLMNGSFTLPMRYLGRWEWENVWSLFILVSCLVLPAVMFIAIDPRSFAVLAGAPSHAVIIAILTGFAWGFGAIMFGQSVSAIGISLANTLVLAISSALGSLLPLLILAPDQIRSVRGVTILTGIAVEIMGIGLCGWAGRLREKRKVEHAGQVREFVGRERSMAVALLLAIGAGTLSAVFNIGFALAQPIARHGLAAGMSQFASVNLIWGVMLAAGSVANLGFCMYLFAKNRSWEKFRQPGASRLYALSSLMALLWGGSIFVYGMAAPRLGSLGPAIGWPLSLAIGLLLANAIGIGLGEWRQTNIDARTWMYSGIAVLLLAIVILSRAGS